MILGDGTTEIEFFPTALEWRVEDFTELFQARQGDVIAAAAPGGQAPQRTRTIGLRRTTAQRDALLNLLAANDGAALAFTDDVGRIWNAYALGDYASSEDAATADAGGWHSLTLQLWLESLLDDDGREAYANVDVSQMSIQKAGAAVLYFPLAYGAPLGRRDVATAFKQPHPEHLAVDEGRYTARRMLSARFAGLGRAFLADLENYFVDTIKGAAYPFTLVHFRDGSANYRWTGGFAFSQTDALNYEGGIEFMQEI